jgi:hypothetical protein
LRHAAGEAHALVERLAARVSRWGPRDGREKLRLLERLATCVIREPGALLRLHEALCFLQAYADDARILAAVSRALEGFPARIRLLDPPAARRFRDSGIAGTVLQYPFGFPMARWLAQRFPRSIDVAWNRFTKADQLREALGLLVHPMEEEAFSEFGLPWRHWLRLAKGGRRVSDVELLVELFERAGLTADARDALFEGLALPITWTLREPGASRTLARLPGPRPFFRRGTALAPRLARRPLDVGRAITRPVPALRRAPRAHATRLIDAARSALAVRHRELHGISYANPDDVLVADPGRGLRIALIGVLPEHRLPLESFFGYLVLQNGVPVGYGGAWHLFGTLEFGVNIFETFRRGESGHITTQVLRVFHHALRVRTVVLQPFQVGHGNAEALSSGAFHFYYRLGFRPRDRDLARLAEREQARIARSASYRTPLGTLERLAGTELFLAASTRHPAADRRITARELAGLVTDHVARTFAGDRDAAGEWARARIVRALGVAGHTRWSPDERRSLDQLSLLAALVPDLEAWGASDKSRLARLLRAKGGRSEVPYVRLLDGHRRFRASLEAVLAGRARALGAEPDQRPGSALMSPTTRTRVRRELPGK